jgi:predicted enzyme involved in methoxymalonyl-ACP biosynthesis
VSSEVNTLPASVSKALQLPADAASIVRQRKSLVKELLKQPNLVPTRVAILGGSTTAEVKNMLELFLLGHGVQPSFYESGYNRFSEDVLFENPDLRNFKPDIAFIHTNWRNVSQFPELMEATDAVENRVRHEMDRFESIWKKIHADLGAVIVQNNFDLPQLRPLGNRSAG